MANASTGFGKLKKESLIREGDASVVAPVENDQKRSANVLIMVRGRLSWCLRFISGSVKKSTFGTPCVEKIVVGLAMPVLLLTLYRKMDFVISINRALRLHYGSLSCLLRDG